MFGSLRIEMAEGLAVRLRHTECACYNGGTFGVAGVCMANESWRTGRMIGWDAEKKRIAPADTLELSHRPVVKSSQECPMVRYILTGAVTLTIGVLVGIAISELTVTRDAVALRSRNSELESEPRPNQKVTGRMPTGYYDG